MWQPLKIFKVLNTLNQINFESTLNQVFLKTNTFSEKLEHRFLFVSTMNENATFPYKAALSEGNAKTNRITKNGVLPATSLIFESAGVLLEGTFFPVSILNPFMMEAVIM